MGTEMKNPDNCRRKALKVSVSALCMEVGFSHADNDVLETLTEMLQSYIYEAGRNTRCYTELSGRTEPLAADVVMALIEMGSRVEALESYSKRANKMIFMPPLPANPTVPHKTLQAGERKTLLPHIPEYMPQFPDPHTYIKTFTYKPPSTEYQMIREKAASQKRDVECALTKFIAKTGETESLFSDDPYAYPLIANKPKPLPYLDALLPKEEDLDSQETEEEQATKQKQAQKQQEEREKHLDKQASHQLAQEQKQTVATPTTPNVGGQGNKPNLNDSGSGQQIAPAPPDVADSDSQIDNPYLRAIKMPKLKATGKKYASVKW